MQDPPPTTERNLYDILGAKGTETKEELKQLYAGLAKKYHPDRLRHADTSSSTMNNNTTSSTVTTDSSSSLSSSSSFTHDFTEIAAAYKTLANPKERKRYDRSLQAAQFSRDVSKWAEDWGRQAAPAVNQVLDQVAVPFLRRTTATTLAGIQAMSSDFSANRNSNSAAAAAAAVAGNATDTETRTSNNSTTTTATTTSSSQPSDLRQTFEKAIAAAKRAGKYVDSMELVEKSEELEQRVSTTRQQASAILEQRQRLMERRIQLTLHTPQSGLTSTDALFCLSEFNKTTRLDELTMMDRLLLRNTVRDEIEQLRTLELEYVDSQRQDIVTQTEYQKQMQQQVKLQMDLKQAKTVEADARLALERAVAMVAATKSQLNQAVNDLALAKSQMEDTTSKLERKSHLLETQSERVRRHLMRKEKTVQEITNNNVNNNKSISSDNHNTTSSSSSINATTTATAAEVASETDVPLTSSSSSSPLSLDDNDETTTTTTQTILSEIDSLKAQERQLTHQYEQLEASASKMTAKAQALQHRAKEWKTWSSSSSWSLSWSS